MGEGYTSWSRRSWEGSQRLRLQTYCRKRSGRTSRSNWNCLMLCLFREVPKSGSYGYSGSRDLTGGNSNDYAATCAAPFSLRLATTRGFR